MDGTHYPANTIAEMAAIPAEARGRFLAEMPAMLDMVASANALSGIGILLQMERITWVDDDKGEHTIKIRVDGIEGDRRSPL